MSPVSRLLFHCLGLGHSLLRLVTLSDISYKSLETLYTVVARLIIFKILFEAYFSDSWQFKNSIVIFCVILYYVALVCVFNSSGLELFSV